MAQPFGLAGVMGWPVSHSRSPLMHNLWLKQHGIQGVYVPLPVQPERLPDALRGLPLSMTEDNLDSMTRTAQASGAKVLLVGREQKPALADDGLPLGPPEVDDVVAGAQAIKEVTAEAVVCFRAGE